MRRWSLVKMLLVLILLQGPLASAEVIKIGVFSGDNFTQSMKKWQPTASFLKQQMPEHVFQVLPYSDYNHLSTDLARNKLDMLLTESSNMAEVMSEYSLFPIVRHGSWTLARNTQLSASLANLVSAKLLKYPGEHKKLYWQLIGSGEIELSVMQSLSAWVRQAGHDVFLFLKAYLNLLIACLVASLLIFSYRHWDRYHMEKSQAEQHRQQPHNEELNNSVF